MEHEDARLNVEFGIRLLEHPVEIHLVVSVDVGGQFDGGASRHGSRLGGSAGLEGASAVGPRSACALPRQMERSRRRSEECGDITRWVISSSPAQPNRALPGADR